MATVKAYIRTTRKKADNVAVRFRLSDGRKVQLHHVSEITINSEQWDYARQELNARVVMADSYRNEINNAVASRKALLRSIYDGVKDDPTPERWSDAIDRKLNPVKYQPKEKTFFDLFDDFIGVQPDGQRTHLMVLRRCLQRWEMYVQATKQTSFKIDINKLNDKDIQSFDEFLTVEYSIQDDHPEIYKEVPETRRVKERGNNARTNILNRLRMFFKWAIRSKRTDNNPFDKYKVREAVYGTPYYITIDERNALLNTDMSSHPEIAVQRDIFVFQCLIGCRVSDLSKLTKASLKDDGNFVEYIPRKTKDDHPVTVRVPLTAMAKGLVKKYDGVDKRGRVFPFISDQKYNVYIKKAFTLAGLNRLVTIIDPATGEEEQLPLNEVASSHLARRCFVGNLYKRVKDPNLVGALSGHVEGSKAFARYRTIDDEIKQETIKYLE